jgi:Protein of unknown function (DUF4058)
MTSPFPGMDPYLEISGDWRDFHATFIASCRDAIRAQLPANYVARIDERFRVLEMPADRGRVGLPDVSVVQTHHSTSVIAERARTALMEPAKIRLKTVMQEEIRETLIEIRRQPGWILVTSIELLSPTNKVEPGFSDFCAKRLALIKQPVHLVELDLLIGGHRLPMDDPLPIGDYFAMISRSEDRPVSEVYFWSVRQAFPVIPVPLSQPDPDIHLDLSPVFATTYQRGQYDRSIDYSTPLALPLDPTDRAWAEAIARTAVV